MISATIFQLMPLLGIKCCTGRGQRSKLATLPSRCRLHLSGPPEPSSKENRPPKASLVQRCTQQAQTSTQPTFVKHRKATSVPDNSRNFEVTPELCAPG